MRARFGDYEHWRGPDHVEERIGLLIWRTP